MKTTNLFKAVAFVAMTIVSVMNTEVKAQENNFITNEEVKNELVVAKTIFKQDGAQLYRHIRYEYSYGEFYQFNLSSCIRPVSYTHLTLPTKLEV